MKQKFNIITSTCVPLPLENVDTDPDLFLHVLREMATTKRAFGENLFRDWRYDKQGNKFDSFVLNDPTYSGQVHCSRKELRFGQ